MSPRLFRFALIASLCIFILSLAQLLLFEPLSLRLALPIAALVVAIGMGLFFLNHFLEAVQEIKDQTQPNTLTEKDHLIKAVHESGHAIAMAAAGQRDRIQRIVVTPEIVDGKILHGFMQYGIAEGVFTTREDMLTAISTALGGRCAEILVFSTASDSAAEDIRKATFLAGRIVYALGMSETFPNRIFGEELPPPSMETLNLLDREMQTILDNSTHQTLLALALNREILDEMALYLLDHGTLEGEDLAGFLQRIKNV